jgi:hypothetical protein
VPFIVLIGRVQATSLSNFLEEYFHDDHYDDDRTIHCVLMQPYGPEKNPDMQVILQKNKYMQKVHYLEGTTIESIDLKRCLIDRAEAVIILSDKFSFDADA